MFREDDKRVCPFWGKDWILMSSEVRDVIEVVVGMRLGAQVYGKIGCGGDCH